MIIAENTSYSNFGYNLDRFRHFCSIIFRRFFASAAEFQTLGSTLVEFSSPFRVISRKYLKSSRNCRQNSAERSMLSSVGLAPRTQTPSPKSRCITAILFLAILERCGTVELAVSILAIGNRAAAAAALCRHRQAIRQASLG